MNVQIEIGTTKHWMILPAYLRLFRSRYEQGLIGFEEEEKVLSAKISIATGEEIIEDRDVDENGNPVSQQRDKFVSILYVDGPITRNGGACSFGSRELRDRMMDNANNPDCIGHVFYINTPGGSAWAKNDFQQAIDFAHEKKQSVIAYVDGMCCSAGMYLAALCDERYYMHPKNEIGCIGVMAAFYTEADGSKNKYTNETYHELYDPESFDKNKEMRDIANEGDSKLLIEELAKLGVEFRADVLKACPNAKDEHLHGKVFSAEDVKGILMDGQKTLQEVFNRVVEISPAAQEPAQQQQKQNMLNPNNNSINMKEKFPTLYAALKVEEMQMSEDGAFLNMGLLETLNAFIEAKNQEIADAKKLADDLTAEKDNLTAQIETIKTENAQAVENLNAEHQKAIDDLNAKIADQEQDITAKEETIGNLQNDLNAKQAEVDEKVNALAEKETELNGVKESLTTAEQTLAERDQQITDLNAQLTELQNNPGAEPQAGAAPQNNGGGAEGPQLVVNQYVYDPALSYKENRELEKKWNEEHGIKK